MVGKNQRNSTRCTLENMLGKRVRVTINYPDKGNKKVEGILERKEINGSQGYYVSGIQISINSRIEPLQKMYVLNVYPRKPSEVSYKK